MAAVAAARPPISGYQLHGTSEEIDRVHASNLREMFQSFEVRDTDIEEIRAKLQEEGKSPREIEAAIQEFVEKTHILTSPEGISEDQLRGIVTEYRSSLSQKVQTAAESAIRSLPIGFHWKEPNIPRLSVKIWFDATTDLRTLKDVHAKKIEESSKKTIGNEEPVYELSDRVFGREDLSEQLNLMGTKVTSNFQSVLQQYPLPRRIIIEWKLACPEENRQSTNLDCDIPPLARSLTHHSVGKIFPDEAAE